MDDDAPWTRDERAQLAELLSGIDWETAHMIADWLGVDIDPPPPDDA